MRERKALIKYDDNFFYQLSDSEIIQILEEKEEEQSKKNIEQIGNKQVDLIIFAGQDNMTGSGMSEEVTVESIWNSGYEIRFDTNVQAVGVRRIGNADTLKTTLVPAFVNAYYNNTGAPVLAVHTSADSSSISSWAEGTPKYNELKTKIESSIDYVRSHTENFTLRRVFMVWFQGERDVDDLDSYELNLISFFESVKAIGVEQIFMIRTGHLYRASGTSDDEKQRRRFNAYTKMIKKQTEFNRKSNLSVLVSVKAAALSLVKGGANTTGGKISDMMINQMRFSQLALDIIGSEAGMNAAYYANTGKEPIMQDLEYKDDLSDYYYTGFDSSQGLTDAQARFLYQKMMKLISEGNAAGILQYGILSKQKAYQLRLVPYESVFLNGREVIFMDGNFTPGNYIGLDCSGFASFAYHYAFGLPFDYTLYAASSDPDIRVPVEGTPWSTREYLNNPTALQLNTERKISMFKYVGELKSDVREYTLLSPTQHFVLRTGDLIIGKNTTEDAHIIMYIGRDSNNGKHVYLHSTSNAGYNANRNGKRYHIDFAFLSPESVDGSVPVTHLYKTVTVLRLNNGILPENFIGNSYDVDFSELNTTENGYHFEAEYEEGTQAPEEETWLENHSVYISLEENQTNEV